MISCLDVPIGEKGGDPDYRSTKRSPARPGLTGRDSRDQDDERWFDQEYDNRDGDDRDADRRRQNSDGSTVHSRFEDKDITDLKMVSEQFTYDSKFSISISNIVLIGTAGGVENDF